VRFAAIAGRFGKTCVSAPATFASIARTGARVLHRKNCGPIGWKSGPTPGKFAEIAVNFIEIFAIDVATFATFDVTDGTREETRKSKRRVRSF
jgi:hypothetical protein